MKSRTAAIATLLMLVASACGARLTQAQRAAGIGGGRGGGAAVPTGLGTSGPGATVGPGGTIGPGGGATTGPGGGGAAGAGSCPAGTNTASDTGVTPTQVTIATASDQSGIQAALFRSTIEAMRAVTAYINSLGGICGRTVRNVPYDTRTDSTANQAAVKQACSEAFALVGSMSAFDDGGAEVGEDCGIPDLTAITVNGARALAKNVYPIYPIRPDKLAIGTANYIKEKYGDSVIKKAAMFYLNAAVTKSNAEQRMKAYRTVGFDFIYVQDVQPLEGSYNSFVQKMKDRGVQYVSMVANYQSIQKLLDSMEQNDYFPKVRDWDSVAYSPNFVQRSGRPYTPANGSLVYLNTAMSEEAANNPEMQLYFQWLARVAPGGKPDYFGFYAWSAGRLFQKVATQVGPKLTRGAFLNEVRKIHSWNGNGLHVAHDIGSKTMSPCFLYLEIQNGRFIRKDPSSGFICNKGGVIAT